MNKSLYSAFFAILCCSAMICGCGEKHRSENPHFTKADSLTDTYLALQDSMLQSWNVMINDDNHKLDAMQHLLHELKVSSTIDRNQLVSLEHRLDQLRHSRYTQKTMGNTDIVTDYDFASNALVTELISLAEQQTQFAYNTTLQKLTDEIRLADQRVNNYREEYDLIAAEYNQFIDRNKSFLRDIDDDSYLEKRPLFQMVSEEDSSGQ